MAYGQTWIFAGCQRKLPGRVLRADDFVVPSPDQYTCLTKRIANLVADETAMSAFRHRAADYFETHFRPEEVGDYILRCVEDDRP
jgi:hypothetical protein